MLKLISFALISTVPLAPLCAQTQSQYQTQNNQSVYQSQYQVNGSNGAGQGQGAGSNQAQADYNASASIHKSPVSPSGSVQTQTQSLNGGVSHQKSTTTAPISTGKGQSARNDLLKQGIHPAHQAFARTCTSSAGHRPP
ncbi:hypothetical protein NUH86_21455 [Sphingobium sp. JS3065]|uniref:hypothetical protein n=1 Tax=Sphingobium sp. JS3065 TaxID=2970925 RepID=UPI002264173A|nr:hypothetical protein [Sphingobium sp. JS3065]UZW57287.1 hypothetical protein NUH86_21455 [Sphingobium sp. JS3065]